MRGVNPFFTSTRPSISPPISEAKNVSYLFVSKVAVDYSAVQSFAICCFKQKTFTKFLPAYEESFESQTFLYRLNDPIGLGWNLFGIEDITISYFVSPVALWIIQVVVTLLGHMLSVVLAHDLSVKMFGHEQSDKTQYIFLFITVALTLQALFVLSVP